VQNFGFGKSRDDLTKIADQIENPIIEIRINVKDIVLLTYLCLDGIAKNQLE